MWGGGGDAGMGADEVGAGESFFYMNPNLNNSWRVEEEGVGYG